MKKCSLFWLIFVVTAFSFLLLGCSKSAPTLQMGGIDGLWVDQSSGSAYRMTKEGLYQIGSFDWSTNVFTPGKEDVYIIQNGKMLIYEVPESTVSRGDWSSLGGYFNVNGNNVEAEAGYALFKGNYYLDESQLQAKVDLARAQAAFLAPLAGGNNQPGNASGAVTAEPAVTKVQTFEGIWVQVGEGKIENGMQSAPVAALFRNGRMYMGLKGQTADEIFNDSAGVRGSDKSGAPFELQPGKLILTQPDGAKTEWQRDGTTFWAGDIEFQPEDGVIIEVDPQTLDWSLNPTKAANTPAANLQSIHDLVQGVWVVNGSSTSWEFKADGTFVETMSSSTLASTSTTTGSYTVLDDGRVYLEYGDYAIKYTVTEVSSGELVLTDEYQRQVQLTK